jgi:hypothetical protein
MSKVFKIPKEQIR